MFLLRDKIHQVHGPSQAQFPHFVGYGCHFFVHGLNSLLDTTGATPRVCDSSKIYGSSTFNYSVLSCSWPVLSIMRRMGFSFMKRAAFLHFELFRFSGF